MTVSESVPNGTLLRFGIILMTDSDKPFDMRRIVPGLSIAFEKIHTDLGITIEPVLKNYTGSCPWDAPVGQLSELHHDYNVHGVIGPACSQGLESAGRLAQFLKIPMVTGLGDLLLREPLLGDLYNTLTIVSFNLKKMSCEYLLHYVFKPIQYTAIFTALQNYNFHLTNFDIFLIFAQNINCGYTFEPSQFPSIRVFIL